MMVAPPPDLSAADYAAIEAAVMETARGRWFLAEFARRQRAGETARLSEIVERLAGLLQPAAQLTALAPPRQPPAHGEEPAAARRRLEEISERLSDIAWSMRERGFDGVLCTEIGKQAREIAALTAAAGEGGPDAPTLAKSTKAPTKTPAQTPARASEPGGAPGPSLRRAGRAAPGLERLDALSAEEKLKIFN